MTVKELITTLQKLPKGLEVVIGDGSTVEGVQMELYENITNCEGEENATPEAGDMVELEGVVEKIEGGVAMVRVNNAMAESSEEESAAPEESEEDRMMKMAEESDKENYS